MPRLIALSRWCSANTPSFLPPTRIASRRCALKCGGAPQDRRFIISATDQHHADGQVVCAPARNVDGRMAARIERRGIGYHVEGTRNVLLARAVGGRNRRGAK